MGDRSMTRAGKIMIGVAATIMTILVVAPLVIVSIFISSFLFETAKSPYYCEKVDDSVSVVKSDATKLSFESVIEKDKFYDYPKTAVGLNADNCKGIYMDEKGFVLEITEDNHLIDAYGEDYVIDHFTKAEIALKSYLGIHLIPAAIEPDGTLYFGTLKCFKAGSEAALKIDKEFHNLLVGEYLVGIQDPIWFHNDDTYHESCFDMFIKFNDDIPTTDVMEKLNDTEDYEWSFTNGSLNLKDSSYRMRRVNEDYFVLSNQDHIIVAFIQDYIVSDATEIKWDDRSFTSCLISVPAEDNEELSFAKINEDGFFAIYDSDFGTYNPTEYQLNVLIGYEHSNTSKGEWIVNEFRLDEPDNDFWVDMFHGTGSNSIRIRKPVKGATDYKAFEMYYEDSAFGQYWIYEYYLANQSA